MIRIFSFFVLICWTPLSLSASYGEWGDMGWDESGVTPINEDQPGMVMPGKGDVGFPAYPGAKVISVAPINEDVCSITLRTPSSVSEVCDFYEDKFKESDGYDIRSKEEEVCYYSAAGAGAGGVLITFSPNPVYSNINGDTQVMLDFNPRNNYTCR